MKEIMRQMNVQEHSDKRQYNSIDLFKFILSFVVVAIHTKPLINSTNVVISNICERIFNLAVPFFFLASGYLLAEKMKYPFIDEDSLCRIKRQTRSILRMYCIWTLIYAPLAIYSFVSTNTPVIKATFSYVRGIVLVGENYNSWPLWYLLSTFYSYVVISFLLERKRSSCLLVTVSIIASFLSIGLTELVKCEGNLSPILLATQKLTKVSIKSGRIFTGLIYIPIGMLLAHTYPSKKVSWIGFVSGFLLDYVIDNSIMRSYLLILTSISFFGIVANIGLKNRGVYAKLRKMSTIIYLIHMYIWTIYYKVVYGSKTYGLDSFIFTSCLTVALAAFVVFRNNNASIIKQKLKLK